MLRYIYSNAESNIQARSDIDAYDHKALMLINDEILRIDAELTARKAEKEI
jgi:hypothetical protein